MKPIFSIVFILAASVFFTKNILKAQGVGVNADGSKADNSAMLDVFSTNKGMLVPRIYLKNPTDAETILLPAHSLFVFNTNKDMSDGEGFYFNSKTPQSPIWVKLNTSTAYPAWLTGGNDDVNDDVSYMGTNIDEDVVFRRNGVLALQLATGGALLAAGDATGITPFTGKGSRMMWVPAKAAFRAGNITAEHPDYWNDNNVGLYSLATGQDTWALGDYSIAMGFNSRAMDNYSVAIGRNTKANNAHAIALGFNTASSGNTSMAMGFGTNASGNTATAMGDSTEASGEQSTAMGYKTLADGVYSLATGYKTSALGIKSTAMGDSTTAQGDASFAAGKRSKALGKYSTAFGEATAIGDFSVALGSSTATALYSVALGFGATANGVHAFAAGSGANAFGDRSVAFNDGTTLKEANYGFAAGTSIAKNTSSVAMGSSNEAIGLASVALGQDTYAAGTASFSMGSESGTIANYSAVLGKGLYTSAYAGLVIGTYNRFDFNDDSKIFAYNQPAFQIGNGTSIADADRSNALTVLRNAKTGINTVGNPLALLHLKGINNGGWDSHIRLEDENSTDYGAIIYDNQGMKFRNFDPNDQFYFRNATNATTARIESDGDMIIAGNLTENSDIRFKENIRPLTHVLEKINQVQPITYFFKDKKNHPQNRQIGFSAQEVEKQFPELVSKDEQGFLSVNYTKMSAVLWQLVKEQQEQILRLEENYTAQKKTSEYLKTNAALQQKQLHQLKKQLEILINQLKTN